MDSKRIRRTGLVIGAVAAVLVPALTACSSSTKSSASAAGLSGDPIKLMWIGAITGPANRAADVLAGPQTAVTAINAAGGINGRPLELIACDDAFDANKGSACARRAVAEKVVALVGEDTSTGEATMPILDAAKIPSIGIFTSSASENNSAYAFPIGSGTAGEIYGSAVMFGKLGCKKPAVAYGDFVAAKFVATSWILPVLEKDGLPAPKQVAIPASATDLTTYAESLASGGTDCVSYIDNGDKAQLLVKALYASHPDVKYVGSAAVWGPKRIAAVGDASKSLYLSFGFATPDSSNAKYRQYNTEMEASGSKADRDELSRSAWNATHVTADLLKTLKTVDSASLIQAAKSAGAQDFGGGVAPWNWSTPVDLLPGARTFGSSVFFAKVGNGTLTPLADGKAFDVLEPGTVPNLGS